MVRMIAKMSTYSGIDLALQAELSSRTFTTLTLLQTLKHLRQLDTIVKCKNEAVRNEAQTEAAVAMAKFDTYKENTFW